MQEGHPITVGYAIDTTDQLEHVVEEQGRQLGSMEHLFWLTDQNRSVHFAVAAEVEGKTSRAAWRYALDRVQERHPLLSVRIARGDGGIPRFEHVEGASLPLRLVDAASSSGFEAEIEAELAIPFDPDQAPLARAVLIHDPEEATLIFTAHHAIADGMSIAYVIRDVLSALAGERLEALPLTQSADDLLAANHPSVTNQSATAPQEEAPPVTPIAYRPDDGARPKVQGLQLSQALTARLRQRARQEATTVHGALVAALAVAGRTASDAWRDIPVRVLSPINIRDSLGIGENCGVYVSASPTVFEPALADFWDLARHARESVERGRPPAAVAGLIAALQQVAGEEADIASAAEFARTALAREGIVTNLGVVPFGNRFGKVTLKAMWGPAVIAGLEGEQTIGVTTIDDALHLLHTSHTPPEGGLVETMRNVLLAAVSV